MHATDDGIVFLKGDPRSCKPVVTRFVQALEELVKAGYSVDANAAGDIYIREGDDERYIIATEPA